MKQPADLARRFLALAERDLKAFRKLAGDPDIDDEIVGFHAQQAVEKCLKAVLANAGAAHAGGCQKPEPLRRHASLRFHRG